MVVSAVVGTVELPPEAVVVAEDVVLAPAPAESPVAGLELEFKPPEHAKVDESSQSAVVCFTRQKLAACDRTLLAVCAFVEPVSEATGNLPVLAERIADPPDRS